MFCKSLLHSCQPQPGGHGADHPDAGALIATPPDTLDVGDFPPGVYHRFDYALWYRNLQANVALRCQSYLGQDGQ
ncbi:hypothetical protein SAMN02746065_104116 [Desulfocicer vacuolatum DSM 3385]|uniref:Uncharacterized protein n=1 Tax=Desulfocicer vacuolatum DSM 3385 TaxID=1121400 RepID=A0A1W2A5R6_9BACT|nr:hypothetical protein SAMN02746065_104116 [Desulfocicer vacuolatum DSM 3385]